MGARHARAGAVSARVQRATEGQAELSGEQTRARARHCASDVRRGAAQRQRRAARAVGGRVKGLRGSVRANTRTQAPRGGG